MLGPTITPWFPAIYGGLSPFERVQALFQGGALGGIMFDHSKPVYEERVSPTTVSVHGAVAGFIPDHSGNNNNGVSPSDAARGLYQTGGKVLTDGIDDASEFDGTVFAASDYTFVASFAALTPGQSYVIGGITSSTNANYFLGWNNASQLMTGQFGNDLPASATQDANPHVISARRNSSGRVLRLDGTQKASDSDTTQLISFNGAAITKFRFVTYNQEVYRVFAIASALSDDDLALVESWVAESAGVSL